MQGFKRCYKDSRRLSAELQDPMRSPEHPWGRKSIQKQEELEAKESDWLGVRACGSNLFPIFYWTSLYLVTEWCLGKYFLRDCFFTDIVPHHLLSFLCVRLSYNKTSVDCASALFYSMMKLAIETPHSSTSKYFIHFFLSHIIYILSARLLSSAEHLSEKTVCPVNNKFWSSYDCILFFLQCSPCIISFFHEIAY